MGFVIDIDLEWFRGISKLKRFIKNLFLMNWNFR